MRGPMSPGTSVDVVVVGAGPAGSRTAQLLASEGLRVTLLEEHAEVGRPVACAGLLSNRVADLLGERLAVLNRVGGARIHAPSGRVLYFDAGIPRADVVDRAAFDQALARKAIDAGARLLMQRRVLGVSASASGCVLRTRDLSMEGSAVEEVRCAAVVGADGPASVVRRSLGIPRPRNRLTAYQVALSTPRAMDTASVDLYAGHDVAPGFFAWVVPLGERSCLAGLASEPGGMSPKDRLERVMSKGPMAGLLEGSQPVAFHAGTIPLGPINRPVADGAVLVGDSAGQCKATSGGGVYPGLVAARHATDALVSGLGSGDLSSKALMAYPRAFDREVGGELRKAARLRRSFRAMSDRMVDDLVAALDDPELLDVIVREGDIEFPSRLVTTLLRRSPKLLRLAGPLLRGFF